MALRSGTFPLQTNGPDSKSTSGLCLLIFCPLKFFLPAQGFHFFSVDVVLLFIFLATSQGIINIMMEISKQIVFLPIQVLL